MAFKKKRNPNKTIQVYYKARKLRQKRCDPHSEVLLTAAAVKERAAQAAIDAAAQEEALAELRAASLVSES